MQCKCTYLDYGCYPIPIGCALVLCHSADNTARRFLGQEAGEESAFLYGYMSITSYYTA